MTLANNHVLDFGAEGLADVRAALDAAGVAHAGAGMDRESASAPVFLHCKEQTVGVLAILQRGTEQPAVRRADDAGGRPVRRGRGRPQH